MVAATDGVPPRVTWLGLFAVSNLPFAAIPGADPGPVDAAPAKAVQ
jgi:hypothetical protein